MRVVESVTIERAPEDVWAVVSDLESHTAWRPALREFRQVTDGPVGIGTRIREVLTWRGRDVVIDDVVTAFEPPRKLAMHGEWSAAAFDVEFRLEAVDAGMEVTMDWPLYPKSFLLKVASPLMAPAMRRATREELELLKAHVER